MTTAIDLIKKFEGFRSAPYLCPAGKWTIGYGFTTLAGKVVTEKTPPLTMQEGDNILKQEVNNISVDISKLLSVSVTQNQMSALVDFTFNLGIGNLKASSLLKRLNLGDYQGAANEFPKWNHCNEKPLEGLTRRRQAERDLFLKS